MTAQNLEHAATTTERAGWAVSARTDHLAGGPDVGAENLPAERRVSHLIDVARALSLVAHDDEATETFLRAESMAPNLVRIHPSVRETVKGLYRRSARDLPAVLAGAAPVPVQSS